MESHPRFIARILLLHFFKVVEEGIRVQETHKPYIEEQIISNRDFIYPRKGGENLVKNDEKDERLPMRARRRGRHLPSNYFLGLDRVFDDFRTDLEDLFWTGPFGFTRGALTSRTPLVDIIDSEKEIIVNAEVPGIPKENVDINVTERAIEISAEAEVEKEQKEEGYHYRERSYNRIHRVLPLPAEVVADKAEANLKDGVLEVRIPKKKPTPEKKKHKVKVK
jgi:HSP20 family protein